MGDLYGEKWSWNIKNNDGDFSRQFKLWCTEFEGKSVDDVKRGFDLLKKRIESNFEHGKENWPPSYAEFKALCKPYIYSNKDVKKIGYEVSDEQREANSAKIKEMMKGINKNET